MDINNLFISFLTLAIAFAGLLQIQNYLNMYCIGLSKLIFNDTYPAQVFYSITFFLGIIIHEISHLLTAMVLGVKTGEINIIPRTSKGHFQMGSVKVVRSDIFRSTIIGASPLIVGTLIIFFLLQRSGFSSIDRYELNINQISSLFSLRNLIFSYVILTISNTMMLSKSDRKAFFPMTLCMIVTVVLVQSLYQDSSLLFSALVSKSIELISHLSFMFYFVFFLNLLAFGLLFITVKIIEKISKKKIVFV